MGYTRLRRHITPQRTLGSFRESGTQERGRWVRISLAPAVSPVRTHFWANPIDARGEFYQRQRGQTGLELEQGRSVVLDGTDDDEADETALHETLIRRR